MFLTISDGRFGVKLTGLLLALALACAAGAADLDQARKQYELTNFEDSLKVLRALPQNAEVLSLMGRNYFMMGDYKRATNVLEKAVAAEPSNSDYVLWLGRAYGRRAETSNPISAIGHASKASQSFERSVQLNPRNIEALNDLLEYYLEAPGIMGGGLDKAQATVDRIARVDNAEGYWAQSQLDQRRKQYDSAEEHLRRAVQLAPKQASRFIDLARFLYKQGRYQEADQSFERALQIAPDNPKLMYARADCYIQSGRNLELARDLLQRYLSATISPDDPPKSDARKLLGQLQKGG